MTQYHHASQCTLGKLVAAACGLAGALLVAAPASAVQFTTINPAYQQEIYAKGNQFTSFYVPGAFTPSGQLIARLNSGNDIVEFSPTQNTVYQGTNLHGVSATHTITGGLMSGANLTRGIGANAQYLYLPTTGGLQRVDTNNWAAPAVTLAGTAGGFGGLGVNTMPNGNIVHSAGANSQDIYIYNPTTNTESLVHTSTGLIDDIETSLTGLIALAGWQNNEITLLNSSGGLIQTFSTTNFPDGLAFATMATPPALYSNDNKGTITRYDFGGGYSNPPTATTVIASGGSYGDIATPGPDCAFYVSHFNNFGSHGSATFGTRWDNNVMDDFSSITKVSLKDGCMVDHPVSTMPCPNSGNLADLINTGGMICNGDKKFSNFSYHPIGNMPDASLIDVVSTTDSQGNLGIRFIGPFVDQPGGGASEALLEYVVTATDPDQRITDVHLAANANVVGQSGYATITETFLPDDPNIVLEAFDFQPGTRMLTDAADLTKPQVSLHVQKDITLFAANANSLSTISFIDQTFSQKHIPEPSSLAIVGLAGMAICAVRRRGGR